MKYLKSEKYYYDLYDLFTIKECLRLEKQFSSPSKTIKKTKSSDKEKLRARFVAKNLFLYYTEGNRFKKKIETIKKWMKADQLRDKKLKSTNYSKGVYCGYCSEPLDLTSKHLHDIDIDKLKVLFFFECPGCNKKKAIYENGEGFKYDRTCPKCKKGKIKSKYSREGNVITTIDSCLGCDYKEKEIMNLDKNQEERKQKEKLDRELLRKFRSKYCLSDKEGQEYIAETERFKILMDIVKEQEKKQKDPAYKKAKQLKKLKVLELEKLLKKVLEKEKYINLQFNKPQIDRFVIIPFTVQDADNKQEEYDSRNNLRKLIKKALGKTNWRLMSEGISYRLGYLSGKLKGYEKNEDLIKIIK